MDNNDFMNAKKYFSLTDKQKSDYQNQPDGYLTYDWEAVNEVYEIPPFLSKTTMRFWYNTQNTGFSTHWHDAQETIVPLEEGYTVTVQDKVYHLLPGDILIIPPGILHSISAPSCGARFIFLYELDIFCQLTDFFRTQALLSKPVLINEDTCPEIYEKEISLIMEAAGYYWGGGPSRQLRIYACLMNFYACYTEFCSERALLAGPSKNPSPRDYSQRLARLLSYLQQNYMENISLEDAAQKAGLSKFYFSRIFKEYTGQTFYDYLSFLRISHAESLLKDTSTPIAHIALACGYSNLSSFNRSFRRFQKCTPSQYRSLHGHGM